MFASVHLDSRDDDVSKCRSLYDTACALLQKPDTTFGRVELDEAVLFLAKWRAWASTACREEALLVSFLALCAARMAVLDLFQMIQRRAQQHTEPVSCCVPYPPETEEDFLFAEECAMCKRFEPPTSFKEVCEKVTLASRNWNTQHFQDWPVVAYAVTFKESDASEDEVEIDEAALSTLASFERECTVRQRAVSYFLKRQPATSDATRTYNLSEWLKRLTKSFNDEVYSLGQQAVTMSFMTPNAWRKGIGNAIAKLQAYDPEANAESFKIASLSYNLLKSETTNTQDPYHLDLLLLFYVDYNFKQNLDFSWTSLFCVFDLNADVLIQRMLSFRNERLLNPPPLVVCSMKRWFVFVRHSHPGRFERVEVHDSFASAFVSWVEFVETKRKNIVFLSKNIERIVSEMFAPPPIAAAPLTAQLADL